MQIYFLSLAYYVFTILILLLDEYRLQLGFMFKLKHYLIVKREMRLFFFFSGIVLCLLNLFFPVYPGPVLAGDLFPAVVCFFIALYYVRYAKEDRKTYLKASDKACAVALAVFYLIHFFFPNLVLF